MRPIWEISIDKIINDIIPRCTFDKMVNHIITRGFDKMLHGSLDYIRLYLSDTYNDYMLLLRCITSSRDLMAEHLVKYRTIFANNDFYINTNMSLLTMTLRQPPASPSCWTRPENWK